MSEPALIELQATHASCIAQLWKQRLQTPWSLAMIEHTLQKDDAFGWAIRDESGIASFCLCEVFVDEADLLALATRETALRRGYARRLLDHAKAFFAAYPVRAFTLEVSEHNLPAQALYKTLGFCVVGRRRAYYKDSDALLMRCAFDSPFSS